MRREQRGVVGAWAADGVEIEFTAARSATGNALDGLRRALQGMTRHVSTPETFSHHLALLQLDLTDPALREPATQHTRAVRGALRRLLDEAVETGDLQATDTEALAAAVHSVYTGAVLNWGLDPCGPLAERLDADLAVLLDPYRVVDLPDDGR